MKEQDTVKLLQECDSGSKMAVNTIDEILESVRDPNLKEHLKNSKKEHEKLQEEIASLLEQYDAREKEPTWMARGMSWMKINAEMLMEHSDTVIARLTSEGCSMGIRNLSHARNEYQGADEKAGNLCDRMISSEKNLLEKLQAFL